MKITLDDGFSIDVDEARLDNMELVEAISDLTEEENPLALARVARHLLGREGKTQLYAHFRTEDGRVPTAAVSGAVGEILQKLGNTGKNS